MAVKKEINWAMVELYVKSGCSQAKIAASLCVDEDTLRAHAKSKYGKDWSAFSASLRSEGDILIEAQQYQKAMKGYWPALLWLGKTRLGQREPEPLANPANQQHLDQSHRIMELEHELAEVKAKINAN